MVDNPFEWQANNLNILSIISNHFQRISVTLAVEMLPVPSGVYASLMQAAAITINQLLKLETVAAKVPSIGNGDLKLQFKTFKTGQAEIRLVKITIKISIL